VAGRVRCCARRDTFCDKRQTRWTTLCSGPVLEVAPCDLNGAQAGLLSGFLARTLVFGYKRLEQSTQRDSISRGEILSPDRRYQPIEIADVAL
jgi:hypothetical protein